jgi:hypothetical protein
MGVELKLSIISVEQVKAMKARGYALPGSVACLIVLLLICRTFTQAEGTSPQAAPTLAGCPVFPADNVWNAPVDTLPLDANSTAYVKAIGEDQHVHADFGSGTWGGGPIGIPYVDVPGSQPKVDVTFDYDDESDPGPYPIPTDAPIEGGPQSDGDRHVLVLDRDNCILYEMFYAFPRPDGGWHAGSGAVFDLNSNALRPETWTSADAAGLPILPGLVRYDEVAAGEIDHALRFTAPQTRRDYVWPARHYASNLTGSQYPPMGQRFRLRAGYDISGFLPEVQVILRALKKYGMILADNGAAWYISGVPDERWNNDWLHELHQVYGSAFEAVDESSLMVGRDSGQVRPFTLNMAISTQAIEAGGVANYPLTVAANVSFSVTVTLDAVNPSPSLTLELSPTILSPPASGLLTLTDTHPAGPLLPGLWYSVPITAAGGGLTQTATVGLLVGGTRTYLPVILKDP